MAGSLARVVDGRLRHAPHFNAKGHKTLSFYDGPVWIEIHRELVTQAAQFAELEAWFADLAGKLGGVPLSRLRLHDILLWCHKTDLRELASHLGRDVVGPT